MDLSPLHGMTIVIVPQQREIVLPGVTVTLQARHEIGLTVDGGTVTATFRQPQPHVTKTFSSRLLDWALSNFASIALGSVRIGQKSGIEVFDGDGRPRGMLR